MSKSRRGCRLGWDKEMHRPSHCRGRATTTSVRAVCRGVCGGEHPRVERISNRREAERCELQIDMRQVAPGALVRRRGARVGRRVVIFIMIRRNEGGRCDAVLWPRRRREVRREVRELPL